MEFSKLLSPSTRVIFIADTPRYAAECFRLDALDYLISEVSFPVFFEAVNKASRWFSLKGETGMPTGNAQGDLCEVRQSDFPLGYIPDILYRRIG